MKKLHLIFCLLLCLSACAPTATPTPAQIASPAPTQIQIDTPTPVQTRQDDWVTLQILIIGNSHTFANDLPKMLFELARSGGHKTRVRSVAIGGYSLEQHVENSNTLEKIDETGWDYVVLQENSRTPRGDFQFNEYMVPAARTLDEKIKDNESQTILLMTWASLDTYLSNGIDLFASAQEEISARFHTLAGELDALLAPVGTAWEQSLRQNPKVELWGRDNVHATPSGTYLMACVLYATIYQESPEGLDYRTGLPEDTALFLQTIAAETVLTE